MLLPHKDNGPVDSKRTINHLLAIGPLPPPPSGSNVSFQVFCDYLTTYTDVSTLTIIDSSPKRIKDNTSILTTRNLRQALRICGQLFQKGRRADCILIFGSNQFLLSLTPLLVLLSRILGKPCFVRSFGGSLDQFSEGLHPLLRRVLLWGFGRSNGLLVETKLLYRHFSKVLPENTHHVTAYRPLKPSQAGNNTPTAINETSEKLRLVFISWVRAEKGVRDLLHALQSLLPDEQAQIHCDIFGPIVEEYKAEFDQELAKTPSASYGGVLDNAQVLEKMQSYNALIFPTYYQGEGYPGVIVEAMAAGLPVITTNYRSIPDMIDDGVNGYLVPPRDPDALATAIRAALNNTDKLRLMGKTNYERQRDYDIRTVLPEMIALLEANI